MNFIKPTIDELNERIIWPKYAKYIYIYIQFYLIVLNHILIWILRSDGEVYNI